MARPQCAHWVPQQSSGDLYTQATREFTEQVERLLAESRLPLRRVTVDK